MKKLLLFWLLPCLAALAADQAPVDQPVRPPFQPGYGKTKAGETLVEVTLLDAAGASVQLSDITAGKTAVVSFWKAGAGMADDALAMHEAWARKYADQGVLFVGIGAYGSWEEHQAWLQQKGAALTFPVLFDPAGSFKPGKPVAEMNDEEQAAFRQLMRDHYARVVPMQLAGGMMAPLPHHVVVDPQGRLLGFYTKASSPTKEALGNLLLRAGIKLTPEDMPAKAWSDEDIAAAMPKPEPRVELLTVGTMAPDFTSIDAAGNPVRVSDFKGRVVVLDFWATWCGPCIASMPHTQEVAAKYQDQGVVVLAACTSDRRALFEKWVATNQGKYPDIIFTHDPLEKSPDRVARKLYGVGGIPQQFVIDREGRIVAHVTGYLKGEAILDAALAKAGIAVDPALVAKGANDLKARENMRR
jgi:peroxiredoxin